MSGERLLTRNFDRPDSHTLRAYRETGGYTAWAKAQEMTPEAIIEEVKRSNLRGLGGAGFPTGVKWSFVPRDHPGPIYLVVNADEGEPGTFKDRTLLEGCPHLLIEGIIVAAVTVGARKAYVYLRREFHRARRILEQAVAQAQGIAGAGRTPLVWNGRWVQTQGEEGEGLAGVRQAIALEVAFAPAACKTQRMRGMVLIAFSDARGGPRVALGTGSWRWSDLLNAR